MPDYDPRLVELYDVDNPDGPDHDYVRSLADAIDARSVLDLGCGTGLLTVSLARPGRRVVGVDPSATMLAYAVARPGADGVTWVQGDSRDIPGAGFDLALMTGNVAQHIPDPAWERTLADVARALRDGGTLTFESRNPRARAWVRWSAAAPTTRSTRHGRLREWMATDEVAPGRVQLTAYNDFVDRGELVVETTVLEFRDRGVIERQLADAGFRVAQLWSDWSGAPYADDSPLMIVEARRV